MAFWGKVIKPGIPLVHNHNDNLGRLRLSKATLGDITKAGEEKTTLLCKVGEKDPISLCSLFPKKKENSTLNVEFEERKPVTFSVEGQHNIHLSGYFFTDVSMPRNEEADGSFGSLTHQLPTASAIEEQDDLKLIESANNHFNGRRFRRHYEPEDPESRVLARVRKAGFKRIRFRDRANSVPRALALHLLGTSQRYMEIRQCAGAEMRRSGRSRLSWLNEEQFRFCCISAEQDGGFDSAAFLFAIAEAYKVRITDICCYEQCESVEYFPKRMTSFKRIYVSTAPEGMDALVPLAS